MEIKVLGPGCANCLKMEELAKTSVKELGIKATVANILDVAGIARHGVSSTRRPCRERKDQTFRKAVS
ncbi:MAG TPA: thioredoxin family protein [Nitrospirota bacterium]|nr:thioredoxin family protein [Nitrospirota bacterium]